MYRCVSVTYKHKTFCKIYTGTASPTAGRAGIPGMWHKHFSAPALPRDSPGQPGRADPALVGTKAGLGPLPRSAAGNVPNPVPDPSPTAAPAQQRQAQSTELSLRLHTLLPVSPV